MCAADQRDVVIPIKLLNTAFSEEIPRSPWRNRPALNLIRVRPHEIAHRSIIGYFLLAVDVFDIVEMVGVGRQPSVHAEDLLVYDGGKGKVVEDVRAVLPDIQAAVLPEAFIIEAVNLGYLTGLVVSSQQGYPALVSDLQGQKEDECLNAVEATVDEISEEEVGDVGRIASNFEELQEIVELAVDVAADSDWRIDAGQVGLFDQDLLSLIAQHLHTGFLYEFVVLHLLENLLNGLQIILHAIQKNIQKQTQKNIFPID